MNLNTANDLMGDQNNLPKGGLRRQSNIKYSSELGDEKFTPLNKPEILQRQQSIQSNTEQ